MWGEIDPPVKTHPTSFEREERSESPSEEAEVCLSVASFVYERTERTDSAPPLDLQDVPSAVKAMIEAVALSGSLVKSQQIDDDAFTLDERRGELLHQYRSRPLVFLERYHACLKPQHLSAFSHVSSDPRAQHYSRVIQRHAAGRTDRTKVRNHRYAALRALQNDGQYFSEEQMRMREPLLYEQYIGQYLTDEEVLQRSQEAMLDGAQAGAGGCGGGGLAHLLLDSYQERLIQNRMQAEQEREDGAQEEEEDEEEEDTHMNMGQGVKEPTPEEKALLREEFISLMHQSFLDGKDRDFNYSEVDGNPDYDNLDIVSRDAEEKYFDRDEEEEEEEEFEEEDEKMTDLKTFSCIFNFSSLSSLRLMVSTSEQAAGLLSAATRECKITHYKKLKQQISFSLLDSYQERLIQNRMQAEQEREDGAQEEEEDEEEEDTHMNMGQGVKEPTPEEKALLREEFISLMHQSFLDGKDRDFNYSEVDGNPDYDNLDIVSRDAEEKYFDRDEEEEEEEEFEEEDEDDEKMTE
ncbi:coiled-coil domain-containing protein 97 [Genypterus blacodes]|uniref:coiled-coil domain-containing protein 97 n=1 Tax=Genypterus blacodes TaxID=154954 RepID=UPI003F76A425